MIENSSILTEFWEYAGPSVLDKLSPVIQIFKVVGIVVVIYFIFLIVRGVMRMQDHRRLGRIEQKVDLLLGKKLVGRKLKQENRNLIRKSEKGPSKDSSKKSKNKK